MRIGSSGYAQVSSHSLASSMTVLGGVVCCSIRRSRTTWSRTPSGYRAVSNGSWGCSRSLFDDGSPLVLGEVMAEPQLVSELVAGGVLAVVRRRMLAGERGRFVELAPELMAFVAAPYLGQDAARAQLQGLSSPTTRARGALQANGRVIELPIRVTHRTTLVLRAIAAAPGVSNRDIAREAGPIDQGQLSNLLTRLAERGLIENHARDDQLRWPNAWRLTRAGERVLALIGQAPPSPRRRVRGAR